MSTKSGSISIACTQLGVRKLSVVQSNGVSTVQGSIIEVTVRTVGTFGIVCYNMGTAVEGCPLSKAGSTTHIVQHCATLCNLVSSSSSL